MDEREASPGKCLRSTRFIDSDHPSVTSFTESVVAGASSERERAVRLFYAVRDRIRYDPYVPDASPDRFKASTTLQIGATFCIPKAILLTASARAAGIPARLHFADVRNHLATRRLLELLKSDVFVFHGYTELWLDESWLKATPTFNLSLCEKFGVRPLEFDGRSDAIFHAFDRSGKRHMEYVRDRGVYTDLPFDAVLRAYRAAYPHLFDGRGYSVGVGTSNDDFEAEAARETD